MFNSSVLDQKKNLMREGGEKKTFENRKHENYFWKS